MRASRQKIKMEVNIGTDPTVALGQVLSRFELGSDVELKRWVDSLPDSEENESGVIVKKYHRVVDPGKTEEQQPPVPADLIPYITFATIKKSIPEAEQRAYQLHVIKPNSKLLKLLQPVKGEDEADKVARLRRVRAEQERILTIDQSQFIVSDRFIYVGGSREFIGFKLIDITKMKTLSQLAPNQKIMETINLPVAKKEVIHLEMQRAISMRLQVNNQKSYIRPPKTGWRSGVTVEKNPIERFIVVLDVIAPSWRVRDVLMKKIDMVDEIVESKPNSQQARMIQSFKAEMDAKSASEIKENGDEDDEAPNLVSVDESGKKSGEDSDDDVEDIEVPAEAMGAL